MFPVISEHFCTVSHVQFPMAAASVESEIAADYAQRYLFFILDWVIPLEGE